MKCIIDDNDLIKLGINLPNVIETEQGYVVIDEIEDKIQIKDIQYILDKTMSAELIIDVGIVYPYKCESDRTYVLAFKDFLRSMQIKMVNKDSKKYGYKKFAFEDTEIEVSFTLIHGKEILYTIKRYNTVDEDVINLTDYRTAYDLLKELRILY